MTISAVWCLSQNFGDALNPWLISRITGKRVVLQPQGAKLEHYIVCGSILNWANEFSVVWGAGLASFSDVVFCQTRCLAVRGPLTRLKVLAAGANCPPIYGDPALLLPRFYKPKRDRKRVKLGIVPHYIDHARMMPHYLGHPDVKVINVFDSVEDFVEDIVSCDRIVASALHGLVVADAYGVPNLWAKFSDSLGGDGFKFYDYLMSVKRPVEGPGSVFLDSRDRPDKPPEWWMSQKYELGTVDTAPMWAFCPFDPKGDPAGARKRYLNV